jgi:hypothetical protein
MIELLESQVNEQWPFKLALYLILNWPLSWWVNNYLFTTAEISPCFRIIISTKRMQIDPTWNPHAVPSENDIGCQYASHRMHMGCISCVYKHSCIDSAYYPNIGLIKNLACSLLVYTCASYQDTKCCLQSIPYGSKVLLTMKFKSFPNWKSDPNFLPGNFHHSYRVFTSNSC